MASPVIGIGWHLLGAVMAATFYVPIERARKWAWETTWAFSGIFSWILLPICVSLALLPDFFGFYAAAGWPLMIRIALFGALWGVGNVTYGLTVRYLGLSLGIGVAIGITLTVGTLLPPLMHGQAALLFATRSGLISMAGVLVSLIGVALVSWAGHQKERQRQGNLQEFNVKTGVIAAILCGFTSSGMSFGIDAAKPLEQTALHLGVNPLYAALPAYVLIMGGGVLVNWGYCFFRLATVKEISFCADMRQPLATSSRNLLLAATGGVMWYLQFFFYAWGAANIPQRLSYVNWMLHMSCYVLCGGVVGLALGEWKGVSTRPTRILCFGIVVIIVAANIVGIGMSGN